MCKMQSLRCQCTLCACSVFSALFGIVLVSTGVCLVLNYGLLEVDTSGLPPEFQNEEGKRIVGIIIICVGLFSIGISALVSILYYVICSKSKPEMTIIEDSSISSSTTSNSSTKPKTKPKHKTVQELKHSARHPSAQNLNLVPPPSRHPKRHKRKNPHHYQKRLATHKEEGDVSNLVVRYAGGETRIESCDANKNNSSTSSGVTQCSNMTGILPTQQQTSSAKNDSTIHQSVIIKVNSLPSLIETDLTTHVSSRNTLTHEIQALDDDMSRLMV